MIKIANEFLPKQVFTDLQQYCLLNKFNIVQAGEKEYSVLPTPNWIFDFIKIPNHELILTFIRSAYNGFNEDYNIHSDNIINGHKTALASVLYINNPAGVSENGTCFWKHKEHGIELPPNVTDKEFDRLITEDSNDLSKWKRLDKVTAEPNKLVLYKSNYFHSKWPKRIQKGTRVVLVSFYRKKSS